MRKVRKMLSDKELLREINRQKGKDATNGVIDETVIETIMSQIPLISNRSILKTLSILRKKLPKEIFKSNLKAVLTKRSNMLDDFFDTQFNEVVDSNGDQIMMPVTIAKHLPTLIQLVCEKRGYDEDNIKLCLGIDGGQAKILATLAVIPKYEKDKQGRKAEKLVKDRSKSTGAKRCLVVGRIDAVPENRTNVKVLIENLDLPEIKKDFAVIADLKLIDILCGIQSTSSIHCCPYCTGNKVDKSGKPTNKKGTWVKGEVRTGQSLQDSYEAFVQSGARRKDLRNFDSVEFMPLHITNNQENIPVIELYPPPQLHCGILGPANDVLKTLEEHFPADMKAYCARFHIKGGGPGGDLNGPTLKKILDNTEGRLDCLSQILSQHGANYGLFIKHLRNLGKLNRAVNCKKLNKPFVESIIQDIGEVFQLLQAEFDLSMPLKIHVILSHYMEFFDAKQETLLSYNDEFTESMHSQLRLFEEAHKYLNNKKGSKSHKEMQQKSVVHINSLNLGDI